MAHGIINTRDFVYGLKGQGSDWHKLTIEKPAPLTRDMFPEMEAMPLLADGHKVGWHILMCDDGKPAGKPFNLDTFGYILPGKAWGMVEDSLSGTHYSVERMGMLWDRSFWFVSISLDELKEHTRKGERFQLNFSGALDGSASPQGELSNIRAVCHNTISLSRATGDCLFKVRQSKNSDKKLDNAKAEVEKSCGMAKIFNETMSGLESKECKVDQARYAYAGEVALHNGDFTISRSAKTGEEKENRSRNLVTELIQNFQFGDGNKGETRFDLLQGLTQLHTRGRKETTKNAWTQFESSEFGAGADRKAQFLANLVDEDKFNELVAVGKDAWHKV